MIRSLEVFFLRPIASWYTLPLPVSFFIVSVACFLFFSKLVIVFPCCISLSLSLSLSVSSFVFSCSLYGLFLSTFTRVMFVLCICFSSVCLCSWSSCAMSVWWCDWSVFVACSVFLVHKKTQNKTSITVITENLGRLNVRCLSRNDCCAFWSFLWNFLCPQRTMSFLE